MISAFCDIVWKLRIPYKTRHLCFSEGCRPFIYPLSRRLLCKKTACWLRLQTVNARPNPEWGSYKNNYTLVKLVSSLSHKSRPTAGWRDGAASVDDPAVWRPPHMLWGESIIRCCFTGPIPYYRVNKPMGDIPNIGLFRSFQIILPVYIRLWACWTNSTRLISEQYFRRFFQQKSVFIVVLPSSHVGYVDNNVALRNHNGYARFACTANTNRVYR